MAVLTGLAATVTSTAVAVSAVEAPAAAAGDSGALYAALASVAVALIGLAGLLLTRRPDTPRPVAEPTTYALPREMADMLVEVIAERDERQRRIDALEAALRDAGVDPDNVL